MDFGNAFQDTPATAEAAVNFGHTVDQRTEKLPIVYSQQARGFVKYEPNGERYMCAKVRWRTKGALTQRRYSDAHCARSSRRWDAEQQSGTHNFICFIMVRLLKRRM